MITQETVKTCLRCSQTKPETAFQRDKRGRRNVCRKCRTDSEKLLKKLKHTWLQNHPEGIPEKCECCGKKATRMVLDHCHNSGQIRGWLCDYCNVAIGNLGDTLEGVMNAMKYLQR